jgi:hypothetical protein
VKPACSGSSERSRSPKEGFLILPNKPALVLRSRRYCDTLRGTSSLLLANRKHSRHLITNLNLRTDTRERTVLGDLEVRLMTEVTLRDDLFTSEAVSHA